MNLRLPDRVRRARGSLLLAGQAGISAGLAWYLAHDVIGHPRPFFAPVAAVIILNVSVGQRLRRAVELVFGVALGILVGDVLIYLIGTGPWQIGLSVALVILASVFLGGSVLLVGQAASSAVLVATLAPPSSGIYYTRFVDALVGGVVGVSVMALLLPVNPLTLAHRAAAPALEMIASGLRECADALAAADRDRAAAVLARMRTGESTVVHFRDVLVTAREAATLAPVRWRSRGSLNQYMDAAGHVLRALRNGRVLVRRAVALLTEGEAVPEGLCEAVRGMGEAVSQLRRDLAAGTDPARTRELALSAVQRAGEVYRSGAGFSSGVIVAQLRSIGNDLLRASGLPHDEAGQLVRRAARRGRA